MAPQFPAIWHFIKFSNTHTILVRLNVLCHNIHSNLTEIHIRSDSCGCCYACCFQNILYHRHSKFSCSHTICLQIIGHIHKHFVDGIGEYILRCNIFEIDIINLCAILHIICHTGRSNDIIYLQCWICVQLCLVIGRTVKCSVWCFPSAFIVCFPDLLDNFKQSWSAGYSVTFQGRRYRKTNCFFCPAFISNHKICCQRITISFFTFHRSVEWF